MTTSATTTSAGPIDMTQPLKVYWAPGCTSCLRTKEFLTKNGVSFVSINAFEDEKGFAELAKLGLRRVPIVTRGEHWADGQVLKDVARVAGISLGDRTLLSPGELVQRGTGILGAALRLAARIPDAQLDSKLPGRDRTYLTLGCHIFRIIELFLDLVQTGRRLEFEDYLREGIDGVTSGRSLQEYGTRVRDRYADWGRHTEGIDFGVRADVYYGEQTLHEYLERSVWHSAQHTRQLEQVVSILGLSIDDGLRASDLAGLSLPENVYDDKISIRPNDLRQIMPK